jgi:hypothetical protein
VQNDLPGLGLFAQPKPSCDWEAVKLWQSKTDTDDLSAAIREFEAALPGWWWAVYSCSVSRDASCGPDKSGPDADLLQDRTMDRGFHCDDRNGTPASSLQNVMAQALEARAKFRAARAAQ